MKPAPTGSDAGPIDAGKGEQGKAHLAAVLELALRQRYKRFRGEYGRVRSRCDEDAVHNVRVASRRFLSAIQLVEGVERRKTYRKMRKNLKSVLEHYSLLRDAQVQLETLNSTLPEAGVLGQAYRKDLEERIRDLEKQTRSATPKVGFRLFRKALRKFHKFVRKTCGGRRLRQKARPSREAMELIEGMYKRFDGRRNKGLRDRTPYTFHRARVQFKKLRYAIEVLRAILPGVDDGYMTGLRRLQTAMGSVQDLAVLREQMEAFVAKSGLVEESHEGLLEIEHATNEKLEAAAELLSSVRLPWGHDRQGNNR